MLNKEIANRLRAGALVIIVEESDELLALESAKLAAKQFQPCTAISAADPDLIQKLETQKTAEGTLIISDFLRVFGENPVAVRMVREIALQQRSSGAYSRLVLLEVPGVKVPESLRSDVDYLIPKLPDIKELKQELADFLKQHDDVKIAGNGEGQHAVASSVAGLGRHEASRLFARCWVETQSLDPVWLRKEKATRVAERLGGALTFVNTEDAADVGGLDSLTGWLKTRKNSFGSEAAKKYGLPEPKGVLLLGVPGGGKSLTAKTIGRTWGLPVVRLDVGKLFGSLVGQSESQTRQAIDAAEACAPCILWIDEIEKGLGSGGGLDGGTSQRVLGTLLSWLQDKKAPVFVVATANKVSSLPPELLRKGRFDEIFFVDLPTYDERVKIAEIHLERRGRKPATLKPSEIAKNTEGFTGAEIEQAIIEAMFNSYAADRDVTLKDIMEAVRGTTPLSKTMKEDINAIRSWAETRARLASAKPKNEASDAPSFTRRPAVV